MKINISTIENENAISDVQTSAAARVVGGLEITALSESIGITDISGLKNVKAFWANSSTQGIVTATSVQTESSWDGGIIAG